MLAGELRKVQLISRKNMSDTVVTESGIEYTKSQVKSMFSSQITSLKRCVGGPDRKKIDSWLSENNY